MPWLLATLGLSILGMIVDPSNFVRLAIMLVGWLPAVLGLFHAIFTFGVGAITANRARRTQRANDG